MGVIVKPLIICGLTIAGVVLSDPAVGAGVFLAEKIASQVGPDLDEVTGIGYTVTVPWDDLQLRLVQTPRQQSPIHENSPYNQR